MRKVLAATVMMIAAILHQGQPARAANIDVDVDINLPTILILYCYSAITVNLSGSTALAEAITGTASNDQVVDEGAKTVAPAFGGGVLSADLVGEAARTSALSAVNLQLNNACAVRALTNGSGVRLTITEQNKSLSITSGATTSTIAVGAITTRTGAGAFGTPFDIPQAELSLGTAAGIDFQLPLDFTNASLAGVHTDAAGTTFNILAAIL